MRRGAKTALAILLGAALPPVAVVLFWMARPIPLGTAAAPPEIPAPTIPEPFPSGDGVLAGTVERGEGGGLPDAEVRVEGERLFRSARTGTDGSFRLDGLPGDAFVVTVVAPRRRPEVRRDVRAGTTDLRFALAASPAPLPVPDRTLPPPPGFLSGRFVRSDGGPLAGFVAALFLLDAEGNELAPVEFSHQTDRREGTGSDGFFEFPPVPPGSYRVAILAARRAHDPRYRFAETAVQIEPASETIADLSFACATLRGSVRDAAGALLAGAIVRFSRADGKGGRSEAGVLRTDEKGEFGFQELPGGTGTLEVHAPGFAVHRSEEGLEPGATREVDVRLRPGTD